MPLNYFRGQSQAWCEEALASAQADAAAGKITISVTTGDLSTGKVVQADVATRIRRLEWSLYVLDPVKWPLNRTVSRTRVIF